MSTPYSAAVLDLIRDLYPGKALHELDPAVQVELLRVAGARPNVTYMTDEAVAAPAVLPATASFSSLDEMVEYVVGE